MKRFKKPKTGTITLSVSDIKKIKKEVTEEAVGTSTLLYLEAAKDELGLDFDKVRDVFVRASRYARHMDDHVITMTDLAKDLEKDTGIRIKWRR